jgi:hypothetical protein
MSLSSLKEQGPQVKKQTKQVKIKDFSFYPLNDF